MNHLIYLSCSIPCTQKRSLPTKRVFGVARGRNMRLAVLMAHQKMEEAKIKKTKKILHATTEEYLKFEKQLLLVGLMSLFVSGITLMERVAQSDKCSFQCAFS